QLDRFMTPQNTVAMVHILANAGLLSTQFTQLSSRFDAFYGRANASSTDVKKAWADISQSLADIGKNGNRLMEDANKAIAEVKQVGGRLGQSRDKLDQLLNENTAAFKDFQSNGYPQLPILMADLKKMVRNYTRLWAEVRDDPGRFFLGDRSEGYQP
ncbi:MAG TPA: hypothetical protein VGH25_08435, partial [Dongiaceae bacterium]